jgi:hypothetical protein
MKNKIFSTLGVIFILTGAFILINSSPTITGLAIIEDAPPITVYLVGTILTIIGVILTFVGQRYKDAEEADYRLRTRDRTEMLKQLRRDLREFRGAYEDAVLMVHDVLAESAPTRRQSGQIYNRDIDHLASVLHTKYPDYPTEEIRRDLGGEEMHREKRSFGKKGR